jgi:hypothetical protein
MCKKIKEAVSVSKKSTFLIFAMVLVVGCGLKLPFQGQRDTDQSRCKGADCVEVLSPGDETLRPRARTDFKVAETDASVPEKRLGKTVAAIGDVTESGFWLKTPLVKEVRQGRIVWLASGASIDVVLRPLEAENVSGSQISLDAMRDLGLPFTALEEILVFTR